MQDLDYSPSRDMPFVRVSLAKIVLQNVYSRSLSANGRNCDR
jgi:hypothetical protein